MTTPKQRVIGSSELWHQLLQQASQVALLNRPVLLVGERGTGKELIAERLHYLSLRWQQPYLQVNCAAMSENLLESELFGHEMGAFTGATRSRAGLFERADGGTLFLDELATASLPVQEKLLRVIEYGRFERVGGSKTLQVDVRVVAACNEDLPALVTQGRFRGDLLDRLAFDVLNLPPLRYRKEDIAELAEHFALRMCLELGYDFFSGFAPPAMQQLLAHDWPGNVRELKNVVERSIYRHADPSKPVGAMVLDPFISPWRTTSLNNSTVPAAAPAVVMSVPPLEPCDLKAQLAQFEQSLIQRALQQQHFNQRRTAQILGLTYDQLRAALRKYPHLRVEQNNSNP
nr:phage shock protein operon transcriptional activator [uncultured Tolumonas sp.]